MQQWVSRLFICGIACPPYSALSQLRAGVKPLAQRGDTSAQLVCQGVSVPVVFSSSASCATLRHSTPSQLTFVYTGSESSFKVGCRLRHSTATLWRSTLLRESNRCQAGRQVDDSLFIPAQRALMVVSSDFVYWAQRAPSSSQSNARMETSVG